MIEWIKPTLTRRMPIRNCDVTVRLARNGEKMKTAITFYNGCHRLITSGNYIIVGTSSDKIYFAESHSGYKLQNNGRNRNTRRVTSIAVLSDFVGDYKLQFDAYEKCYCICKKNRVVD